ncbi:MAG TPA: hypothetical protein VGC56_18340 [Allosphingosinicella sp.]|jgi:hypothetical protein
MRRDILEAATRRVVADLKESGIAAMFLKGTDGFRQGNAEERQKSAWISLSAITDFINKVSSYSDAEISILHIFQLTDLADPEAWQAAIREPDIDFLFQNNNRVNNVVNFLPMVTELLRREYDPKMAEPSASELEVQTVILADEGGDSLSAPTRLIELLASVESIYKIIATVEGMPDAKLAVVGLDSGSEKSFDFLGLARLMHELRETLKEVYNMVAFHRQNVTLKNLQVAGETMSVVQKIAKMEQNELIPEEEGRRLRHALYTNLEKFAATGAYTREMDGPRQPASLVMKPQPFLLTGPIGEMDRAQGNDVEITSAATEGDGVPSVDRDSSFTENELAEAAKLLRAARNSAPTPKRRTRKQGGRSSE